MPDAWLACSEGWLAESMAWLASSKAFLGVRPDWLSLRGGIGGMDEGVNGKSPHSTRLRPLSGPLPKNLPSTRVDGDIRGELGHHGRY